jgi:DNA-directed RNA polymerase specialized sigma subunit
MIITKLKRTRLKKTDNNYINNADFTESVSVWLQANKDDNIKRPMPTEVAESIMKLVNNFSNKRNFSGYTYLDDMKSEALITCVKYAHNFDPAKSNNAFAYFTQIINNAFKMFLNKEKYQKSIKDKIIFDSSHITKYNYNNINLEDEEHQ